MTSYGYPFDIVCTLGDSKKVPRHLLCGSSPMKDVSSSEHSRALCSKNEKVIKVSVETATFFHTLK